MKERVKKVVLAYSGGLDTSIIIPWLKENYGCEIIAMAGNIGQDDALQGLEEKAIRSGASKCYVEDLRHEFVTEYLWPLVKSGAMYEGKYLLGTSIARPLLARRQVEIAEAEGADAVAHGCTGKGNDQVRFEITYKALNPRLGIIAPWREWDLRSREDEIDYARARNVPITATREKIYSEDRNLWHLSHEGGSLEDPWNEPSEDMYTLTVAPERTPDAPEYVTLDFESGTPVSVGGVALSPARLVARCNEIGGAHGIGRVDLVENRLVGMKSRGVYETPGVTILHAAHRALESITMDREVMHLRDSLGVKFAENIYYGFWFAPEFDLMRKMIDET